jgi:ribosomal protein L2
MAIKTYRPTTQTLRYRTSVTTDDITSSKPHKPLVEGKIRSGGRRNSGDTTMRFRGGGNKRLLRTSSATSTAFRRPSSPSNTIPAVRRASPC